MQALTNSQILNLASRVVGDAGSELLCTNQEGRVRYANNSACKRLGYDLSELLEKSVSDYTPNQSQDIWEGHCRRTIHEGSDELYTYHRDCNGKLYPVVLHSIPHLVGDTDEQLICSLIQDAQNSKRYQRMLDAVEHSKRIGSFDFNLQDQSILVSDNLLAIMDTDDPESLKPAGIVGRLSEKDVARWNAQMLGFINGYHLMDEVFTIERGGKAASPLRVVMWSSLEDGKVAGIAGYFEVLEDKRNEPIISLEEAQRRHIIKALTLTNGRVTGPSGAERLLDINGKTLFARMKKLNINREDYKQH